MASQAVSNIIASTQPPGGEVSASLTRHSRGRVTVRRVLEATAGHYGTTVPQILERSRKRRVVRRRQMAMYVARKVTNRSLPFIARHMGGWDHTTVLHHVRAVAARLDAGKPKTMAAVEAIVAQLTGGAHD